MHAQSIDMSAPARARYQVKTLIPLLVFVAIGFARCVYVSLYGSHLPYWDQWDELDFQIRPWFFGGWHFLQLFTPHMEHRIAFTRLISFFLATLDNRTFDNLVEAYFNTILYATLWASIFAFLVYRERSNARRWLIALAIITLGALPFDWENTLIGYQNQFYALELVAVLLIGVAAYRKFSVGIVLLLAILALASLFTMASGVLAAPAVIFVVLLRLWRERAFNIRIAVLLIAMLSVAALGLILLRDGYVDTALHAHGIAEDARGLLVAFAWPLQDPLHSGRWLFAVLLWLPSAIWLTRYCIDRRAEPNEIFAVSMAAWVFVQCLAIVHARGHDLQALPSRYTEIPAIGVAANAWLALKLAGRLPEAIWPRVFIALAAIVVGWVFWQRTPGDLSLLKDRHRFTTIETRNVRQYLAGSPLPVLPTNSQDLPYPTAQRLRHLLDNAQIRALVPSAAFPISDPGRAEPLSDLAASLQHAVRSWFPAQVWTVDESSSSASIASKVTNFKVFVPSVTSNKECSLDAINGHPSLNAAPTASNAVVSFGGWAGNGHGKSMAKGLFVMKSPQHSYDAWFTTSVERPDVAKALSSKAMAVSGFNLTVSLSGVASGTYNLMVVDPSAPSTWCNLHRVLTVR